MLSKKNNVGLKEKQCRAQVSYPEVASLYLQLYLFI